MGLILPIIATALFALTAIVAVRVGFYRLSPRYWWLFPTSLGLLSLHTAFG